MLQTLEILKTRPDLTCCQDTGFTLELIGYRDQLSSMDPNDVVQTVREITTRRSKLGGMNVSEASETNKAAVGQFLLLQDLLAEYAGRAFCAFALVDPLSEKIPVVDVVNRVIALKAAPKEFGTPAEQVVKRRGLIAERVTFWDESDMKPEDIAAATGVVKDIQADDSLLPDIQTTVRDKYIAAVAHTQKSLLESAGSDVEIKAKDMAGELEKFLYGKRIFAALESSLAIDEGPLWAIEAYISAILKRFGKELINEIRRHPHNTHYRDGLCLLAQFLEEEERVKAGFIEIGVNADDLAILFAASMFDTHAPTFAHIAKVTHQYNEEDYQIRVRIALRTMKFRNGKDIELVVETVRAVGIALNDRQVKSAILAAAESRMQDGPECVEDANEIMETATRLGVFDESNLGG